MTAPVPAGHRRPGTPRLIGGEMARWSDVGTAERAPAHGPLLTHLVNLLADTGRTLVAGPHDLSLVTALRGVTCLVRSLPDAVDLAGRGIDVLCGTLPKLDAAARYDTVVALDGVDRLCSVEGPQLDWLQSLQALRAVLRPGGTLVLAVENELGVHRLVARSAAADTDADWHPAGGFDPGRPGTASRLAALLGSEGLTVSWLGAGWPSPHAPTLLATPGVLADPGGSTGAMAAVTAAAVAAAYGGRPVLSDPRRLATAAVHAGLGTELAAGWFVVAHRKPGPDTRAGLPPVLLAGAPAGPVVELDRDQDGRWTRRPVPDPAGACAPGRVTRDPTRLAGPMPNGRLLEEELLTCCSRHDLPAARRLLTGYTAWLHTLGAGHAFATFDNVLVDGGRFVVLDPSWSTDPPVPVDVAAARAVRRFATTLVTGGYPHPWPTAQDVETLAVVLAAAAGCPIDDARQAAAVDLEVDVRCAVRPGADRDAVHDEVRRPGLAAPVIDAHSWRDSQDLIGRLGAQLADARARTDWCEAELSRQEAELRRARLQIATFGGRPLYRLFRLAVTAGRRGRRALRRAARSARGS